MKYLKPSIAVVLLYLSFEIATVAMSTIKKVDKLLDESTTTVVSVTKAFKTVEGIANDLSKRFASDSRIAAGLSDVQTQPDAGVSSTTRGCDCKQNVRAATGSESVGREDRTAK